MTYAKLGQNDTFTLRFYSPRSSIGLPCLQADPAGSRQLGLLRRSCWAPAAAAQRWAAHFGFGSASPAALHSRHRSGLTALSKGRLGIAPDTSIDRNVDDREHPS
ncbi:hypothetical protein CBOM_07768 [Ceraceosorus bombacis]|uniref:Uncharacterized protein n=1 Tax=Ceraceosorus bombacis TaxID=401625 RepID=A0A0P1BMN7_9BASI|nr:hypothetical protein CBOM_07768 [Ceraceosorus bombacis]